MTNDIASPASLEGFAEKQVATVIRGQVTAIEDADIATAHGTRENVGDRPSIAVRVEREEMEPPDSGWWRCLVEVQIAPAGKDADWLDAVFLGVETALGNENDSIETELSTGRLVCMAGSAIYNRPTEIDDSDGARIFAMEACFGLLAP